MLLMLVIAAMGAGCYWAGRNAGPHQPAETELPTARRGVRDDQARAWPWVAGTAVLGILLLAMAAGPPGLFGGPGLFAGLGGP